MSVTYPKIPTLRFCAREECGAEFPVSHQRLCNERHGRQPKQRFCSTRCCAETRRKWLDKREFWRERKRRERANLRARGLNVSRRPYVSETMRLASARRIVPPTVRE